MPEEIFPAQVQRSSCIPVNWHLFTLSGVPSNNLLTYTYYGCRRSLQVAPHQEYYLTLLGCPANSRFTALRGSAQVNCRHELKGVAHFPSHVRRAAWSVFSRRDRGSLPPLGLRRARTSSSNDTLRLAGRRILMSIRDYTG